MYYLSNFGLLLFFLVLGVRHVTRYVNQLGYIFGFFFFQQRLLNLGVHVMGMFMSHPCHLRHSQVLSVMLRLTQACALYRDMPNLLWKRQATHSISRLLSTVESCPSFQVKLSTVSTGHLSQCKCILMPVSLSVLQVITLLQILATRRSLNAIPAFCATSQ